MNASFVYSGVQNRGFGFEVSDLRGDLDANERVETRVWEVNDE